MTRLTTSLDNYMVSYAQRGEDVVLCRPFRDRTSGFYIDIGANDPVYDSVTKYFSLLGWRGINVEPVAHLYERLVADRPQDVNLCIAISDHDGTLDIVERADNDLNATASESIAEGYARSGWTLTRRSVPCMTLANICERYCPPGQDIDFLKVDVEGYEDSVIASGDWRRFRPRVLVIEAFCDGKHADYPRVPSLGYTEVLFDGLNRFYVRQEDLDQIGHFFRHPANTYDDYIRFEHAEAVLRGREAAVQDGKAPWDRMVEAARQWEALGPTVQSVACRLAAIKNANAFRALRRVVGRA